MSKIDTILFQGFSGHGEQKEAWRLTFSSDGSAFQESLWSDANYLGVVCIRGPINGRSLQGVDLQQLRTRFLKAHSFSVCISTLSSVGRRSKGAIMDSSSNTSQYSALESVPPHS